MIDPAIAADSQAQAAAAATTVAAISSVAAYQYANSMDPRIFIWGGEQLTRTLRLPSRSPFTRPSLPSHAALPALQPESNAPRSEHGSPRFGQPLARHGSNSGSRYMRQSAYDQYAARPASPSPVPPMLPYGRASTPPSSHPQVTSPRPVPPPAPPPACSHRSASRHLALESSRRPLPHRLPSRLRCKLLPLHRSGSLGRRRCRLFVQSRWLRV